MSKVVEERDSSDAAELRSFGRRRGRKASPHQRALLDQLLPKVSLDPRDLAGVDARGLAAHFGPDAREVWLEIGFGAGEHIIWQARQNRTVGLLGCEPFEDGVVKVLASIDMGGLDHVRLLADDVRPLLRALPPASLSRVFILFPDPWPKRRHQKRRLIQPKFLEMLSRVMRSGAELRFATDIGDYARSALLALNGNPDFMWQATAPSDWRVRPEDWPRTRYEAKALQQDRRSYYFRILHR